jgi:solute carrier family 25 carnitine/acylcarnitine transporter 20/29
MSDASHTPPPRPLPLPLLLPVTHLSRHPRSHSGELYAAGAIGGFANSFVAGPVEHIRIRLQTQPAGAKLYSGPLDAVMKMIKSNGIAGVFKGQVPTMWRDGIGYG